MASFTVTQNEYFQLEILFGTLKPNGNSNSKMLYEMIHVVTFELLFLILFTFIHFIVMTTNETEIDKQLQSTASNNKQLFDEITIVLNKHQNKYE